MQKIDFVEIPGVKPKDYFLTLRQIYKHVMSHSPTYKEFRRWMREKGWWDKEQADALMAMLGLSTTDPVGMEPFTREIADEMDEDKGKHVIGRRLIDLNPLLAKYCIESMDVENDGRIQSTRELFKMIDSFIYPGEKPTLPAFNAWMAWAEAGDLVRLIGIRWGLSAFARENLPKLKAIDVDEFLEDEEEEDAAPIFSPPETAAPVAEEPPPVQATPQPVAGPQAAHEPTITDNAPIEVPRSEAAPVPVQAPQFPGFYMVFQAPALDKAALKQSAASVCDWWSRYPAKRTLNFGVLKDMGQDLTTKFHAFYVALCMGRGNDYSKVMMTAGALRSAGVFDSLAKGKSPMAGLKRAYQGAWDMQSAALIESAVFLIGQANAIKAFDFGSFQDPKALLNALDTQVFQGTGGLAPFVAARVAHDAGLLAQDLVAAAFIPFFAVRQQAFRMGFIDHIYCNNFHELVQTAMVLAGYFGPDCAFEQPLMQMPAAFGCAFNCGRQAGCPFTCREKQAYNV